MYRDESSELVLIVIGTLALIPIGIVVNGFILAYAWAELLLPIFPHLPVISLWQAVGISTFCSLFTAHLAREKSDNDGKVTAGRIFGKVIATWILYAVIVWLVSLTY